LETTTEVADIDLDELKTLDNTDPLEDDVEERVFEIQKMYTMHFWVASSQRNKLYQTTLIFDNSGIASCACECPSGQSSCSHMAYCLWLVQSMLMVSSTIKLCTWKNVI